ncbi:MAG: hypothetical protein KAK00_02555 [Nanoarchaeota archaeon]|nr:hypothetical protein [Nanoarchaeota archaeon]
MEKSNVFLIEFMVVVPLLIAFLIYFMPYMISDSNEMGALKNYAGESTTLMRDLKVFDLDNRSLELIPSDIICLDCSLSKQLAILILNNSLDAAKNISNSIFADLIPDKYGCSLSLIGKGFEEEVIIRDIIEDSGLMADDTIVSGVRSPAEADDVLLLQIRIWI